MVHCHARAHAGPHDICTGGESSLMGRGPAAHDSWIQFQAIGGLCSFGGVGVSALQGRRSVHLGPSGFVIPTALCPSCNVTTFLSPLPGNAGTFIWKVIGRLPDWVQGPVLGGV